ncbi:MAG: GNAT family N-acetyltransferase [Hyphomicrobiales bacterium]|nr:GNAT family N-acetyltransferase [Hyphomicrobiales bacterium]
MADFSEGIERAALRSLFAAADPDLQRHLGLGQHEVGGAYAYMAAALPASAIVVNRVIGLGAARPATRQDVADMVQVYRDAGVARYFVHLADAAQPETIAEWLAAEGLEKTRGWMKFTRGTEPPPETATDLRIAEIDAAQGEAFAGIAGDAFDLGAPAVPWLARLPGQSAWHIFMTFDGDTPAGCGALYIENDIAWTDWGATAPEFRRRGGQSALLAHRIRLAIDRGCSRIVTCTGEEVPGDPQHSYSNILKMGFSEAGVRENYALPKRGQ